ncbi:MAG: hypothetical protein N2B05_06415 [Gemmatimonadales bacterium]
MTHTDSRRDRILEMCAAALMSIATVATAWCAYQSAEWGGEQAFLLGESQRAGRQADLHAGLAAQKRNLDVAVFMEWIGGIATDNERLTDFYAARFPPNLGIAVEAWLATEPRTNPNAPAHPFLMEEYRVAEDSIAATAAVESEAKWAEARQADENGDRFVLLTVIFASVLFFGGIEQKFKDRNVRTGLLVVGSLLFLGGLIAMLNYPLHLG